VSGNHRLATTWQSGLNETRFVDATTRAIVVINANADGSRRICATVRVLPRFAFNCALQSATQTEPSGLDVDLHIGGSVSVESGGDYRVAVAQEKSENGSL
jgi:hypothetical protein